jgi:flagellar hook-length control protein FliK
MLSRQLNDNLAGDIVRQASIVLSDGGQGTIKLSLKPETLGNVKIRLEMAENRITGHIIVDSEEALRAFEKEVHTLEQAFKDSGFESATLDANLASNNGQSGRQWDGDTRPYFSERFVAGSYDDVELSVVGARGYSLEPQASVNMLA